MKKRFNINKLPIISITLFICLLIFLFSADFMKVRRNGFDDILFAYSNKNRSSYNYKIKYFENKELIFKFIGNRDCADLIEIDENYSIYIFSNHSKYVVKMVLIDKDNNWYIYEYRYFGKHLSYYTNNDNNLDFDFLQDILIPYCINRGITKRNADNFEKTINNLLKK